MRCQLDFLHGIIVTQISSLFLHDEKASSLFSAGKPLEIFLLSKQVCQMVYFYTKNVNFIAYLKVLGMENFGTFHDHLVYFM
jgi:hypothetical protein